VIDIQTGERNGYNIGSLVVAEDDKVMLITQLGQIIKIPIKTIRVQGRNTLGVTLMRLPEEDRIVSIVKVLEDDEYPNEIIESPVVSDDETEQIEVLDQVEDT
jgi:DNA gyrase subunit A